MLTSTPWCSECGLSHCHMNNCSQSERNRDKGEMTIADLGQSGDETMAISKTYRKANRCFAEYDPEVFRMTVIPYSPELPIFNLHQLSKGTGCRYLLCFKSDSEKGTVYVAKQWKRRLPVAVAPHEAIVTF